MTTKEGKIPANVFIEPEFTPDDTFLFDYSLFFSVILYDYTNHTNDRSVLDDLYDVAKKGMLLALSLVDDKGFLHLEDGWPIFIDWSTDFDKTTAGQGVLIYALKRFIVLAKLVDDQKVNQYEKILEKICHYAKTDLYNSEKKQFIIKSTGEINIASQVWLVLAEVFDTSINKQIMTETIRTLFPIKGIATPYMYHHIVESLFVASLGEDATSLMKEYWGKMIDMGADTFWEAFKPEDPGFSPYGSPVISSYCHAWSCTPAYLISNYIIEPKKN